ncbi:hypothetical protein [Pseudobacteriovorax antillogorgiicola]|uniref:DUF1579 domain-containing protein n=1 Tax=Pseudobacteriovorax antillogorgiicola TaxID=1513793 RepID=A0A1Y6BRK9_9BACT|nr:hypothetical protein [Pseudobacteriovorax antillogorgiicola]TCS53178.1 hypothetical protein EDD56_108229 [Pseudobacteriovorax antillogorgiicola]SMF24577.1 hypothetical protein SAMN06296036_10817 [Pseudobacteriovorax antillogorgiicola]
MKLTLFSILLGLATITWSKPKPCSKPNHQAFNFWLGTWDVRTANGKEAGLNEITRVNECLILESWTGKKGLKGSSMNYYDPQLQQWVQHWVSADGTIIHLKGEAKEQGIAMEGTIYYAKTKKTFPFRGEWQQLKDKRVRQYFSQQDPKTMKWVTWFEGFYKKRAGKTP